jgi:uncharacterized protein YgiM (DUF1202 family)
VTQPFRLIVLPRSEPELVGFGIAWAAPRADASAVAEAAWLDPGDGARIELGVLPSPTAATWRSQRLAGLTAHRYAGAGPWVARLHWGEAVSEVTVHPELPPAPAAHPQPDVTLFGVQAPAGQPFQRIIHVKLAGLAADQQVRIDGGAGQAHWLPGTVEAAQAAERTLDYPKPGGYTVALDLLDADGFWLTTLAEAPLAISPATEASLTPAAPQPDRLLLPPQAAFPAADVAATLAEARPWLPYRYARPAWGGTRAYSTPGGGQVTRVVGAGVYLGIRAETIAAGATWWLTAGGDWVAANEVSEMFVSELRGVELGEPAPPPPPQPPPPPAPRNGMVTADALNVRRQPGVRPDNPPVTQLLRGTVVGIYEETRAAGETWYRIGDDRWVFGGYVELLTTPEPPPSPPPPEPEPPPPPVSTRRGVVTAAVLNVRGRPGVRADNPPVAQVNQGAEVTIYEETTVDGAVWYRIGEGRWVHGSYVESRSTPPPQPPPPPAARSGVVTADVLNVRSRPGVSADNPPVGQLRSGDAVTIYAEQTVGDAAWYRIGEARWAHGGYIRLTPTRSANLRGMRLAAAQAPALPLGWVVASSLHVRRRPGVADDNPPIGQALHNELLAILEARTVGGITWYRIGEERWVEGSWVGVAYAKSRPASIGPDERWVGVNLREQTAICYEGDRPVYAALISSGADGTPTVQGIFRTWARLPTGVMAGPGYYIEDVTWTCYFFGGYALHTAYWHDAFGRPRSHGCVNLSPYDAWWVFQWSAAGGVNSPTVYVYWM